MGLAPPYSTNVWKAIIGAVAGLGVLGAVLFFYAKCGTYEFNKGTKQANANLANAINTLGTIQNTAANLQIQLVQANTDEAVQKEVVKQAANAVEIAANNANAAHIAANEAVSNVQAVNAQSFDNTTLANANKARCLAFPSSPECQ